jgi:hypothetical protein
MLTILAFVGGAVAGFVTGVIVGRNNKKKVEAAVAAVKEVEHKVLGK